MKGDWVKRAQAQLGLTADGTFGPLTEAAVRAFHRRHTGLVADGIIGPKDLGGFGFGLMSGN